MNRRDFVVGGTGAMAALGVAGIAAAGAPNVDPFRSVRGWPYKVIVDERFQESRAFGRAAARLGCAVHAISGDVTGLWFNELHALWARGAGDIVGMTTGASLMCLEQLAWNQWMRVVARVDHRAAPDGTVRHRLFLRSSALQDAQASLAKPGRWPEQLAATLIAGLGSNHDGRPMERVTVTGQCSHELSRMSLTSWVIAARSQATPT